MSTIAFYAQFTQSKLGVNSLTVTWDIERITRSDGTRSALVTGGANNITIGRRGLYGYLLTGADLLTYDYVATAITATSTVDLQEIPALWTYWSLDLSPQLSTAHGAGSWLTGGAGSGSVIWNYYVTNSIGGTPIPEVEVTVYSNSSLTAVIATGITDSFGLVTFYLDPGTYYFVSRKSGYNFVNPDIEIVA
jgi:hypothetical protein